MFHSLHHSKLVTGISLNIVGYGEVGNSNRHVVYIVHAQDNTSNGWVVYRRYSQFYSLYTHIKNTQPSLPSCPPKHVLKTLIGKSDGPDHLRQRRDELHEWLRLIVSVPSLKNATFIDECKTIKKENASNTSNGKIPTNSAEFTGNNTTSTEKERVDLKDFHLIKVVGKGSFGKVIQVRKKDTQDIFAMKILHTRTERSVLEKIEHPFIVGLKYAFQDKTKFELRSRFYTAEILLALEHLHSLGVVYRDLKPENILFTQDGHIRLADFGLSKEGYLAPEILNRTGHGCAVDWWSMGALLYEMLTGLPPFYSQERQEMFNKIREASLRFPSYLSSSAVLLLQGLLAKDPTNRLGCGENSDVSEIKDHSFFSPIDWEGLLAGTVDAPWKPPTKDIFDTSQFDQEFTSLPILSPDNSTRCNNLQDYIETSQQLLDPSSIPVPMKTKSGVLQNAPQSSSIEKFGGFTYEAPNPYMRNMFPTRIDVMKKNVATSSAGKNATMNESSSLEIQYKRQLSGTSSDEVVDNTQSMDVDDSSMEAIGLMSPLNSHYGRETFSTVGQSRINVITPDSATEAYEQMHHLRTNVVTPENVGITIPIAKPVVDVFGIRRVDTSKDFSI
eukprot:GSMAST32.ASY1.ANO1.1983.1 assembled CDS